MMSTKPSARKESEREKAIVKLSGMKPTSDWKKIGSGTKSTPWGRWTHQYDAFNFALAYLEKVEKESGSGEKPKSSLIRMPTGTGKTGVMSLIAGYAASLETNQQILVIVPSAALRIQVAEAIEWRYWAVVGKRPKNWRPVQGFTPSTLKECLSSKFSDWRGDKMQPVLVCTTTTISILSGQGKLDDDESTHEDASKDYKSLYKQLIEKSGLVLVDEGHREPAPKWARAIRKFKCPRILFSATPYRNDLRLFDIGRTREEDSFPSKAETEKRKKAGRAPSLGPYRFIFPFASARKNGVIRDVEFKQPAASWRVGKDGKKIVKLETRARLFAGLLHKFYKSEKVKAISSWWEATKPARMDDRPLCPPKVIVRCQSYESVKEVKRQLEVKVGKGKVIAVHNRFAEDQQKNFFFNEVPDLGSEVAENAIFWVHQYMLIEGLDHPGFWIVALFDKFGNERALVQQIGRILREPTAAYNVPKALVFSLLEDGLEQSWLRYLAYEAEEPPIIGPEEIVERFLEALPSAFYSKGAYRKTIQVADPGSKDQLLEELRLPCRASILQLAEDASAPSSDETVELIDDIVDELEQRDYTTIQVIHAPVSKAQMIVFVVLKVTESMRVVPSNFFDIKFAPAVLCIVDGYMFWQGPVGLGAVVSQYGFRQISSDKLRTLLGKDSIVRQTSTLNTDLNDGVVRRKSIGAMDLETAGVALGDEGQAIVSLAASKGAIRRQLNLASGRFNEPGQQYRSPQGFADWAREIASQIGKDSSDFPKMLNRFAQEVFAPRNPKAAHVLIDPWMFHDNYELNPSPEFENVSDHAVAFGELLEASAVSLGKDQETFDAHLGNLDFEEPLNVEFKIKFKDGKFKVWPTDKKKFEEAIGKLFRKRDTSNSNWKPATLLANKATVQVVTTEGLMYTAGRFYEPRQLWGKNRQSQMPEIHGVADLANVKHGEKGFKYQKKKGDKKPKAVFLDSTYRGRETWDVASLFGMMDREKSGIYKATEFKPNWLVCDDMGTEYSDFIAIDDSNSEFPRVAMIHCKMGSSESEKSAGASDLHIVVSQAAKNLGVFSLNSGMLGGRSDKWNGYFQTYKEVKLIRRPIKKTMPTGKQFVKKLTETLGSPNVRREVWLVMGNSVSAAEVLKRANSNAKPPAHVIHLLYLLQSINANASSLGIRVRLITKP